MARLNLISTPPNYFSSTLNGSINATDLTITLNSVTNLPTKGYLVIDRVDTNGTAQPTKREIIYYTSIAGNAVVCPDTTNGRGVGGTTAQSHSDASIVEGVLTAENINGLVTHLAAQHNDDGTHSVITATSVSVSGDPAITQDAIQSVTNKTITGTTNSVRSGGANTSLYDSNGNREDIERRNTENGAFDFVASGCVWTGDSYGSTRAGSMTSGVVYIGGKRVAVSSVSAHTFTASKDTYIDVDNTGALTYTEATNNAASPALASNNIRLGIVVTGASSIAAASSINQGDPKATLPTSSSVPLCVCDTLGNLIYNTSPFPKLLGVRRVTSTWNGSGNSEQDVTGLSIVINLPRQCSLRLTGKFDDFNSGNATAVDNWYLKESSTYIAHGKRANTALNSPSSVYAIGVVSGAAGSHTYLARVSATAGVPNSEAGATAATYIMVEAC